MPFSLPKPEIEFDNGALRSTEFGDVYFQTSDGLAESDYVFAQGIEFPQAYRHLRHPSILELGFGSGLNALHCLDLWQEQRKSGQWLTYVAIEGFPLERQDYEKALSTFKGSIDPALLDAFLAKLPPRVRGLHSITFENIGARLLLYYEDAGIAVNELTGRFDAMLLDGFAPAKNPDMWSEALIQKAVELLVPEGRLASFTAATVIRQRLSDAGMEVVKRSGFGRKRECIAATKTSPVPEKLADAPKKISVVGGGIVGCHLAYFARRYGLEAEIYDRQAIGAGASGNPVAMVEPRLEANIDVEGLIKLASFLFATQHYDQLNEHGREPPIWNQRGVCLQPSRAYSDKRLSDIVTLYELDDSLFTKRGHNHYFPTGGAVNAPAILKSLTHGIPVTQGEIPIGISVEKSDATIWSVGMETAAKHWVSISANRGQLTGFQTNQLSNRDPVLCGQGYLASGAEGHWYAGSSYEYVDESTGDEKSGDETPKENWRELRLSDHQSNLNNASELSGRNFSDQPVTWGRVSLRAVSPDRWPLIQPLNKQDVLVTGFGSRGFTTAPIVADHLICELLGITGPLTKSQRRRLSSERFRSRVVRV